MYLVVGRRGCLIGVARRGRATMFSGERRMFAGVDLRAPAGKVVAPVALGVGRIGQSGSPQLSAIRTMRSPCWRSSSVARGSSLSVRWQQMEPTTVVGHAPSIIVSVGVRREGTSLHCIVWSDWSSQPTVEGQNGIPAGPTITTGRAPGFATVRAS